MLTTNDPALDATFRLLRQHGMSVDDRARHSSSTVVFEEHGVLGFNYRMTDIQAAVGREQLRRLPTILADRRRLASAYFDRLEDVPGVEPLREPAWARSNWQSLVVTLPDGCDQIGTMQAMLDAGVATRRGIMCAHRERPYHRPGGYDLPVSELAQDRCIILPLYPQMSDDDVDYVCHALRRAVTVPVAVR